MVINKQDTKFIKCPFKRITITPKRLLNKTEISIKLYDTHVL